MSRLSYVALWTCWLRHTWGVTTSTTLENSISYITMWKMTSHTSSMKQNRLCFAVIRYLMNSAEKTVKTPSVFDPTFVTITHPCSVLPLSPHAIHILIPLHYQLSVSDPSQTTTAILSMSLTDMKTNLNTKKCTCSEIITVKMRTLDSVRKMACC